MAQVLLDTYHQRMRVLCVYTILFISTICECNVLELILISLSSDSDVISVLSARADWAPRGV